MDLQAKTRKEIADEYGVDVKTIARWCDKRGIELEKRDRIPPKALLEIYDQFGCPIAPDKGKKLPNMPH